MDTLLKHLTRALEPTGLSRYAVDYIVAEHAGNRQMYICGPDQEDYDQSFMRGAALVLCNEERVPFGDTCRNSRDEERVLVLCGLPVTGPADRLALKKKRYCDGGGPINPSKVRAALNDARSDSDDAVDDKDVERHAAVVQASITHLEVLLARAEEETLARAQWEATARVLMPMKRVRALERRAAALQADAENWANVMTLATAKRPRV